ncbi:MAG: hypothetical protein BGO41_11280 [Clostridiales bacterium 38-18]|nr:MAG: hypothetical protein BGO41_11280 [Clostridiales bacterium 38-18]
MNKKLIIVGNGAAGNSALEEILASGEAFDITVVTMEATPPYYRPMLSEYISETEIPNRFYLHNHDWYVTHGIDIKYETALDEIHPELKTIKLSNGEELQYDSLILATGSRNFIPPIPGIDKSNVLNLRDLTDAETLKKFAWHKKTAVIIGGGLLGLELGWQMTKLNVEVTVVEMMERLLPRQLDAEASVLFEEKVKETGIKVIKGVQTKEIIGTEVAHGVLLSDGTILPADFIAVSIGVRAETTSARKAGINTDRAIIVDDFMKTNIEGIFAAGDCAEYKGVNYAIWPEAIEQGRIAALNALGKNVPYVPVTPFNIYHGLNLRLFSIGDVGSDTNASYDIYSYSTEDHFEKFFYKSGKVVGGILIGDISKSSKLKRAVTEEMSREDFESMLN